MGMVYVAWANSVHDSNLKAALIMLTPVVTLVVSGSYFAFVILFDLAFSAFLRREARKRYEIAKRDPDSSPEHIRELRKTFEESERASLQDLSDSWRQWKKGQK